MLRNVSLFFLLTLTPQVFFGQSTANATASANIVNPIGTEKTSDFEIGNIIPDFVSGTLNIKPGGEHKIISIISPNKIQQKSGTASLKIMNSNYSFGVSLASVPLYVTHANNKEIIRLGDFKASASEDISLKNHYTLLSIGATLNIKPGNSAGLYTADKPLNIIVNFE